MLYLKNFPYSTTWMFTTCLFVLGAQLPLLADSLDEIPTPSNLGADIWVQVAKMFLAVSSLLVVMIFATWLMKQLTQARHLQMNRSSTIKITEQRVLDPKTTLYIIEAHNQQFLVANSGGLISTIGELHDRGSTSAVQESQ